MENQMGQILQNIWKMSGSARCQPLDRHSIISILPTINKFSREERIEFISAASNFYNDKNFFSRLMTCIPEVWEDITYDDLVSIICCIKGSVSLMSIVEFFYKYLEIDIFDIALTCSSIPKEERRIVISYY